MGTIFGTLLAFILVFGILVFIHEFGHFFMAKLVGIRVEVFSFGFGKRLLGHKKGQTDYRLSLIPIGGYVKFLGEGAFEPGRALEPDDFMAKNRWQRFLVIAMGSVMNILLAIVFFTIVNMIGVPVAEYLDEKPVIGWIDAGSPASKADLKIDDEILSINKQKVKTWSDVEFAVGTKPDKLLNLEIKRNGLVIPVELLTEKNKKIKFDQGYAGFYGKILIQVQTVATGSPADKGGLKAGDIIQKINSQPVYFYKFIEVIEKNAGQDLVFTVLRNANPVTLNITPRREGKVGKIGISQGMKSVEKKFGFIDALNQSLKESSRMAFMLVDLIKKIFTGQASPTKNLGGPIEIANMSYFFLQMGFNQLLWFIAFFSLQLGVLNLLPIPFLPLDGTQIFILAIEGIIRRDLSPKLKQIWTQIVFFIFMLLFVFIILNDVVKRLPNGWKSLIPF
jgi:regulator of sigma E protease